MKLQTIVQGFGVAILLFLLRVWPLVSPRHSAIYNNFLPIDSMVWGVVIDLAALTLLTALLFTFLEKNEAGWCSHIWAIVLAELLPIGLGDLASMGRTAFSVRAGQYCLYGSLLVLVLLRAAQPQAFRFIVRGSRMLLFLAGCGLAWMLCTLLYIGIRSQPHDRSVPFRRAGLPSVAEHFPGKRIVWILFDELSYRQVFEHPYPGLQLPNFDRLISESTSFSDISPAGYHTQEVVPSLFLGRVVHDIHSNLQGAPLVQLGSSKEWQPFDAQKTIFADAQRLGWTTGVAGWYNPYCRMLDGTVDACYWRPGDGLWGGTAPEFSVLKNAWAPFADWIAQWSHTPAYTGGDKHAADLAAVMPQAEALLRDQAIGFAFVHLPVPHPPGIYDRRTGRIRNTGTYLDNLALADRSLGELMATLRATAAAADTTVIVCSDHSWRLPLWRPTPQWSREETTASEGHFDTRPVLLIHYPGQTTRHDVTSPFAGVRLHDLIEDMLRGQRPTGD